MSHPSYWNLIIGGIGVLIILVYSQFFLSSSDSVHLNDHSDAYSNRLIELQYAGIALVLVTLSDLIQIVIKCFNHSYYLKNRSGIFLGHVVYSVSTFILGLLIAVLCEKVYYESRVSMILNCYRIVILTTMHFFLSYTDSVNVTSSNMMNSTFLLSVLACIGTFVSTFQRVEIDYLTNVTATLYILGLIIFMVQKYYRIWKDKNNYSNSHIMFLHFAAVSTLISIVLRCALKQYFPHTFTNIPLASVYVYLARSICLSSIPGLIAEQEVLDTKDHVNATKTSFQRYIAHEMCSPFNSTLMGIQYCLLLIQKNTTDPTLIDIRKTLLEIKNSTDEGLIIMDNMLLFDKFENGQVKLQKEEVPVKSMIKKSLDMFKIQLKATQIKCQMINISNKKHDTDSNSTNVDESLGSDQAEDQILESFTNVVTLNTQCGLSEFVKDSDKIFIDKAKWRQVYRNIMSNAITFTPENGVIKLRITYIPKDLTPLLDDVVVLPTKSYLLNFMYNFFLNLYIGTARSASFVTQMFAYNRIPKLSSPHDQEAVNDKKSLSKVQFKNIKRKYDENLKLINDSDSSSTTSAVDQMYIENPKLQNGTLVIEIQDSGAGISPENQDRLFKEIVQFNPDKLQTGGGSGLGMCISKGIVDMHGGKISVHSEGEGKGTTFRVEIPMTRELNAKENDIATQIQSSKITVADLIDELPPPPDMKKKVLIVDDVRLNRVLLGQLLTKRGHKYEEAKNGSDAVELVKSIITANESSKQDEEKIKLYDIIFMDYMMPEMNGPDATRAIRALGFTGPIIGVTGNYLDDDQAYFMNAGLTDIILKPVRMPTLVQKARL